MRSNSLFMPRTSLLLAVRRGAQPCGGAVGEPRGAHDSVLRRLALRGSRYDRSRRSSPPRIQRPPPAPERAHEDEQKQHQRRELEGLVGREKSLVPVYQENSPDENGKLDEGGRGRTPHDRRDVAVGEESAPPRRNGGPMDGAPVGRPAGLSVRAPRGDGSPPIPGAPLYVTPCRG